MDPGTWDFAVVGSGFGGSVSALRLAGKGYRVLVLERDGAPAKATAPGAAALAERVAARLDGFPQSMLERAMSFIPRRGAARAEPRSA